MVLGGVRTLKVALCLGWGVWLQGQAPADNEARAVIGFEQAGASAAKPEQKLFFDFFIDRQLGMKWLSLWGDVQVASYPQQITTPLAQFDLATSAAALPVNQLAETAAFATGIDWHPFKPWPAGGASRRFGFVFGAGATGPFTPSSRLTLFTAPSPGSPQYQSFIAQFPQARNSTYIGFIPPDRAQFYRSWGAGFRVTTTYGPNTVAPPATYTVSVGQDEQLTGGALSGAVVKFDVFYPLPVRMQGWRYLYLFGTADMKLAKAVNATPFVLAAAPSNITGSEPSVTIVTVPSNRDNYRIGFGVDAVGLLCAIFQGKCN